MHAELPIFDVENFTVVRVNELRLPLVNRFYSSCNYNVKCGRLDQVYSLSYGGEIIAAARLVSQKSGHLLLRNLFVAPAMRNQGVATQLVGKLLNALAFAEIPANCYCYALPQLKNFYVSLGFKHLLPEHVPEDIAEIHFRNCARKRGWILMGFIII